MLRFLMRYLLNNEKLITKLADSRPMRKAAQFIVYMITRTSSISGAHRLPSDPKEFAAQLTNIVKKYVNEIKSSIESAKEIKKK